MTVARAIKTARKASGFSQEELARRSKTSANVISALERGTIDLDTHLRSAIEDAFSIPSTYRGIALEALGADPASASRGRRVQRELLLVALAVYHRTPRGKTKDFMTR